MAYQGQSFDKGDCYQRVPSESDTRWLLRELIDDISLMTEWSSLYLSSMRHVSWAVHSGMWELRVKKSLRGISYFSFIFIFSFFSHCSKTKTNSHSSRWGIKNIIPKEIYSISGEREQDDTIPLNLCADFKEEPPWTGTQMYSVKAVRSSVTKIERKKSKRERGERWRQKAVHLADGQLLLRQLPAAFLQSAFDSQG